MNKFKNILNFSILIVLCFSPFKAFACDPNEILGRLAGGEKFLRNFPLDEKYKKFMSSDAFQDGLDSVLTYSEIFVFNSLFSAPMSVRVAMKGSDLKASCKFDEKFFLIVYPGGFGGERIIYGPVSLSDLDVR